MKLLTHLEKKKFIWWIIALCMFFFLLRLPSIIEPYWYGDEGVYEVIGLAMDHGKLLYRDVWDNKPPLLYVVYALAQGDQPTVKILSLLAGICSLITFFFLSRKLFGKPSLSILLTLLYTILLGTPLIEGNIANAENFILFPVLIAGLLIFQFSQNKTHINYKLPATNYQLLIAGLLLGIAFLFKIVALFDLVAFLTFLIIISYEKNNSNTSYHNSKHISAKTSKPHTKSSDFGRQLQKGLVDFRFRTSNFLIPLLCGFILPVLLTIVYFALNNALDDFFQSAFAGNVDYVAWENNFLGIPQGLLLLKALLFIIGIAGIIWKRNNFTKPALFITLWLISSLFNAYFSGRPYTHYALVVLPSFCLFIGLLLINRNWRNSSGMFLFILVIIFSLNSQFNFNTAKTYAYYQNTLQFISGQKSVFDYQSFFDHNVPRDYAVALFIKNHTKPSDTIFLWGNNPQIYVLTHKLPPMKYTVAYHVMQNNAFVQAQQALTEAQPKYVIVLQESQPLPFSLPLYIMRYSIPGAVVYERSL